MQIEYQISELLIYLLDKYEYISVGNIGSFYFEDVPSIPDEPEGLIYPPKRVLNIIKLSPAHAKLIDTSLAEGLITVQEKDLLRIYVEKITLDFETNNYVNLHKIGGIKRIGSNIVLDQNDSESGHFRHYLPGINLKTQADMGKLTRSIILQDEDVRSGLSSRKGEKITYSDQSNRWIHYVIPLLLLIAGTVSIVILFKYWSSDETVIMKSDPDIPAEKVKDFVSQEEEPGVSDIFNNEVLNKYKNVLTQEIINEGCKITVGSFKKRANAQGMMDRLLEQGYNMSLIDFDEGVRVILTFECGEHDLIEYLKKIRKEVSPSAWFYQPDFDPEIDEI